MNKFKYSLESKHMVPRVLIKTNMHTSKQSYKPDKGITNWLSLVIKDCQNRLTRQIGDLSCIHKQNSNKLIKMARTKSTRSIIKKLKLSPNRDQDRTTGSPDSEIVPPPSPPASLFEPSASGKQALVEVGLKPKKKKKVSKKNTKRMAAKAAKETVTGGTEDPKMKEAFLRMIEEEKNIES